MKITYDKEANAIYIYFKEIGKGEVNRTITINDSINLDLNGNNKILGIEILMWCNH